MGMFGLLWQVPNDSGAVCLVMLHGIPSSQYVPYGHLCLLTLLHPPFSWHLNSTPLFWFVWDKVFWLTLNLLFCLHSKCYMHVCMWDGLLGTTSLSWIQNSCASVSLELELQVCAIILNVFLCFIIYFAYVNSGHLQKWFLKIVL